MTEPKVAIVIVNYNSEELTRQCLESLKQLSFPNVGIVVVDNASPDGSGARLKGTMDSGQMKVICSTTNRGFAAGCNVGIRETLKGEANFVWLLNPDTEVHPDALTELLKHCSSNSEVAAVGSKILYPRREQETRHRIWSAGGRIDVAKRSIEMRGSEQLDDGGFDAIQECDYLPGCSLLVSRKTIERVGMMPEDYFMYFEETDWCVRMRRAKGKLLYVPSSVVYHKFDSKKLSGPFMVYYYNRNNNIFWSRQLGVLERLKLFLRVALKDLPRARQAERACSDPEQREVFRAHVIASIDFLRHRYGQRSFS